MTWRCSNCGVNWPHYNQYSTCNACGAKCDSMSDLAIPVQEAEALSSQFRNERKAAEARLARQRDFEKYYADREVKALQAAMDSWAEPSLADGLC